MEGFIDPSTHEVEQRHCAVQRQGPDVSSITHTHLPHATAFALAGRSIVRWDGALPGTGVRVPAPVVPYAPRSSDVSVCGILAEAEKGIWATLLANHRVLAFGRDPGHTARVVIALKETVQIVLIGAGDWWRTPDLHGYDHFSQ